MYLLQLSLLAEFELSTSTVIDGKFAGLADMDNLRFPQFFSVINNASHHCLKFHNSTGKGKSTFRVTSEPNIISASEFCVSEKIMEAKFMDFNKNGFNDIYLKLENNSALIFLQVSVLSTSTFSLGNLFFEKTPIVVDFQVSSKQFFVHLTDSYAPDILVSDGANAYLLVNQMFGDLLNSCVSSHENCFKNYSLNLNLSEYSIQQVFQQDLNGDCRPELQLLLENSGSFLLSNYNLNNDQDFPFYQPSLDKSFDLPNNVISAYFSDIDTDSNIDLVVVTQKIVYFYQNVQKTVCQGQTTTDKCRGKSDLCSIDQNYDLVRVNSSLSFAELGIFKELGENETAQVVPGIRVADLRLRRFPSLLLNFKITNENGTRNQLLILDQKEYFNFVKSNITLAIGNVEFTDFIVSDLGGRGEPAILLINEDKTHLLVNNLKPLSKGFYLRTTQLNNLCFDQCKNAAIQLSHRPYGTLSIGGCVKYVTSDMGNNPKVGSGCQYGQPGILENNYEVFGISVVAQYIDQLATGNLDYNRSFTGIVPNSNVFLISYGKWSAQIYLPDVLKSEIVVVSAGMVILVLFAIVVLVLHRKERKQDKADKEKLGAQFQ